jgi:hypothetical protein
MESGMMPPENQALVRFGRRPHGRTNESDTWNFLKHGNNQQMETTQQSTRTTKFTPGFNRRNQTNIGQDRERVQNEHRVELTRQRHAPKRTELLSRLDSGYNCFNIITGRQDPQMERNVRKQMRHVDETKSTELQREGGISLRDSTSRFYGAAPGVQNVDKHGNRVGLVVREGLEQPRFSSVLGIGRSEAPSFGVADAFEYSRYGGRSLRTAQANREALLNAGNQMFVQSTAQQSDIQSVRDLM